MTAPPPSSTLGYSTPSKQSTFEFSIRPLERCGTGSVVCQLLSAIGLTPHLLTSSNCTPVRRHFHQTFPRPAPPFSTGLNRLRTCFWVRSVNSHSSLFDQPAYDAPSSNVRHDAALNLRELNHEKLTGRCSRAELLNRELNIRIYRQSFLSPQVDSTLVNEMEGSSFSRPRDMRVELASDSIPWPSLSGTNVGQAPSIVAAASTLVAF